MLEYTNNAMLTGYTGGKLLWLREDEPDNFAKMRRFICPKDYIRFQLTGELATDVSDASGTGFFNTSERRWSDSLIELAGDVYKRQSRCRSRYLGAVKGWKAPSR